MANHGRARENGGEKKGKVEDGRDLLCGEDSTTNERERQEAEGHACSLMHRYRAVDTVVRTCRLSGQLQEKSFSSKNLSF